MAYIYLCMYIYIYWTTYHWVAGSPPVFPGTLVITHHWFPVYSLNQFTLSHERKHIIKHCHWTRIICLYNSKFVIAIVFFFFKVYVIYSLIIITPPPEGVARYCFHPVCMSVCLCVCVCVRPIFWYFISQLLEELSIWNLYRILIALDSIHCHRSKVKVTGTVHCFLKVQSYHKNWAIDMFCRHLFVCPINWNNKNLSEQRNDVTKNTSIFDV